MNLRERIDWVLEHRADIVKNKSQWALMSKRPDGKPLARAHVHLILRRFDENPESEQERGTLNALADSAGVPRAWFVLGEGEPPPEELGPTVELTPRYHAADEVRALARADGIPADFVASWEALLDYDDQPSPGQLFVNLRSAWLTHKKHIAPKGDPGADLDDRPSPRAQTTRKKR